MRNSICTEIWKSLNNKMFLYALLLGLLISTINIFENSIIVRELSQYIINSNGNMSSGYQGFSLFVNWIAVNGTSLGSRAYQFVWPILATMPYGWAYYHERKTGVYNQLILRSGSTNYFVSKFVAVFFSGGLASSVPVLFNLLINALICPYCIPKVISSLVMIFDGYFLSQTFYTNPWLHAVIWCGVVFMYGGVVASLSFMVGTKPHLSVMVILSPFALLAFLDAVLSLVHEFVSYNIEFSPLKLIIAATSYPNPEWAVVLVFCIMFLVSVFVGYWQVVKHEMA